MCLSTRSDFGFAVMLTISLTVSGGFLCIGHLYKDCNSAPNDLYQHCFQVCRKCHFALNWGWDCCSAILKAVAHLFLPRQYKQMLSAGLPRRKYGYPLLVKSSVGMPVSPFRADIFHTRVVVSNKMLSRTYIGCSSALIILYLTSWYTLINLSALCL